MNISVFVVLFDNFKSVFGSNISSHVQAFSNTTTRLNIVQNDIFQNSYLCVKVKSDELLKVTEQMLLFMMLTRYFCLLLYV